MEVHDIVRANSALLTWSPHKVAITVKSGLLKGRNNLVTRFYKVVGCIPYISVYLDAVHNLT